MKSAGKTTNNNICGHFAMSRPDLFHIVKWVLSTYVSQIIQYNCTDVVRIKKLSSFAEIMATCGVNKDAVGCEVCKPAIGSILSSLHNEHILNPVHHQNQDTNDRYGRFYLPRTRITARVAILAFSQIFSATVSNKVTDVISPMLCNFNTRHILCSSKDSCRRGARCLDRATPCD